MYKIIYLPASKGWQNIEAADDENAKRIASSKQGGAGGIEGYDLIEFRPIDSYNYVPSRPKPKA